MMKGLRNHASPGASGVGECNGKARQALIVGEVALTVVRLTASGLSIRTVIHLKTLPQGFNPNGVGSPTRNCFTFFPTASTCPAISQPRTSCFGLRRPGARFHGIPFIKKRSRGFTDAARSLIMTSLSAGVGVATSANCATLGVPYCVRITAFIEYALGLPLSQHAALGSDKPLSFAASIRRIRLDADKCASSPLIPLGYPGSR